MKKVILLQIIVTLLFSFSENSQRKVSDIKVGNYSLEHILKVHADGLLKMELSNNTINIDLIKDKLNTYLQKNHLNIDYLKEADLSNADLKNLDFSYLNLKEANLVDSDLTNSNLEASNLKEANLSNANLSNANLKGANLKEATVKNVKFLNADLMNADIHEAQGISIKQLLSCKSLLNTKLPEDLFKSIEKQMPALLK